MYSAGRLLYIFGIALTCVFVPLFFGCCWLMFFNNPMPLRWSDLPTIGFIVGIPFALMTVSCLLIFFGYRMQHGKSGRIGGIFTILIGLLSMVIGFFSSAPQYRAASAAYRKFGTDMVSAGVALSEGEDVQMAYPLDPPDTPLYEQRKKDMRVFTIAGILTFIAIYVLFKYLS